MPHPLRAHLAARKAGQLTLRESLTLVACSAMLAAAGVLGLWLS